MRKDKNHALALRSQGKSYSEIKHLLGIPKSTLSDWLKAVRWSQTIKRSLAQKAKVGDRIRIQALNKIRGGHLDRLYEEARREAAQEFEEYKFYPLFLVGLALYWGEGDKTSKHMVRIGNVDPFMIDTFVKFLREVCGVSREKIRAYILLYPDLDPAACLRFWVSRSHLSKSNFTKSITIQGRHKTRRVPYGVCTVGTTSSYLKTKLNVWLQLLPKSLQLPIKRL